MRFSFVKDNFHLGIPSCGIVYHASCPFTMGSIDTTDKKYNNYTPRKQRGRGLYLVHRRYPHGATLYIISLSSSSKKSGAVRRVSICLGLYCLPPHYIQFHSIDHLPVFPENSVLGQSLLPDENGHLFPLTWGSNVCLQTGGVPCRVIGNSLLLEQWLFS